MVHAELESIQGEHLDEMAFALLTSELNSFQTLAEEIFYSRQRWYGPMCLKYVRLILDFHHSAKFKTHTPTQINQHMCACVYSTVEYTVQCTVSHRV